ncbi:PLP-dependent aminotransferase family protein [Pendulispora albinea]|uniref:PLP-dependent aminotransferase family protein n=1 Tax=Pendulispora albinea TaxID=2741071 RepID=A0ABZ2LPQ0_9BACT
MAALVGCGALRTGQRAPSIRTLSRQQNVSTATVVRAYQELEAQGLLEGRPQSGFYVRRPAELLPLPGLARRHPVRSPRAAPAPKAVRSVGLIERLYASLNDPHVIPFGAACPSADLLPLPRLNQGLARIARTVGHAGVWYDAAGVPVLRRQLARRAMAWGCALGADDFIVTVGATEAIFVALRAVSRPGDTIALETPAYFGVLQAVAALGLSVVSIPVDPRDGLDLEALRTALATHRLAACVATTTFHNPLGCAMSDRAKKELVALLTEREVPLIEDDVYGELAFEGARPRPAKAFDRDGFVMLCGSVSKTLAPAYRVGWLAAPARFRGRAMQWKHATTLSTPSLTQFAVAEFLSHGYEAHLRQLRRRLRAQVACVREAIAATFPEGTRVSEPRGGFCLWATLPRGFDAVALAEAAFERGISVAPGPLFGASGEYANALRLTCGHPWTPALKDALATLGDLASRQLGRTVPRR